MRKIVYMPEPGFVYDLIQRFHVHFEQDVEKSAEADNHAHEVQAFFADPPEELRLFFDENSTGAPMLLTRYFDRFGELLPTGKYDYFYLKQQLSDLDGLLRNVTAHFFPLLTVREVDDALTELQNVTRLVRRSCYDDGLKNRLLCFYIEPAYYQELLLRELETQSARLRQYYDQNAELIDQVRDSIDLDALDEQMQAIPEMREYVGTQDVVCFACPLIDAEVIYSSRSDNARFLLLGVSYQASLEAITRKLTRPDLYLFGKILSEPKRLLLIDTLLDGRAMCKDDICTLLGLSMTATHYHIDMMSRAWMLRNESRGRTFYYTLNRSYFDDVIRALQKYSTDPDGSGTTEPK